ncbi:hypothetical protein BD309DRAFT_957551 [Dichomitus squalens]|uniref:Uncharacterized protein n=1 Tax=Dichomitus squalens TaxID=114155 RepID=A0A4Q9NT37_9APHY|nr:hypothetical protein BD311DRAFT_761543 [Dichomitus squalens]TBU44814.1 hypothetical protein BD309DRAFT_957551 [Dichomitus squalens]
MYCRAIIIFPSLTDSGPRRAAPQRENESALFPLKFRLSTSSPHNTCVDLRTHRFHHIDYPHPDCHRIHTLHIVKPSRGLPSAPESQAFTSIVPCEADDVPIRIWQRGRRRTPGRGQPLVWGVWETGWGRSDEADNRSRLEGRYGDGLVGKRPEEHMIAVVHDQRHAPERQLRATGCVCSARSFRMKRVPIACQAECRLRDGTCREVNQVREVDPRRGKTERMH